MLNLIQKYHFLWDCESRTPQLLYLSTIEANKSLNFNQEVLEFGNPVKYF